MTTNYDTTRLLRIIMAITYDNNVGVIPSRDVLCYNVSIMQIIRNHQYAICLPTIVLLITIKIEFGNAV